MIRPLTRTLATLLVVTGAPAVYAQEAASPEDLPFIGSVSAADPRAEAAGMEMLKRGGSATDAAIATMLALTVVEPQSSGIGGGGFLVRGAADGSVETVDGRETAPMGATPEWFLNADGSVPPFMDSVLSGLSVGVPGNVALAAEAHGRHGKLPWAVLFEPAIKLARDGFAINVRLAQSLAQSSDRAAASAGGRALFYDDQNRPLPAGTLVRNPDLARTFEAIAKRGPEAFYRGPIARETVETVASATPRPAPMTEADIAGYEAKLRDGVCGNYRGYRICGMGPPSSGGVAVLQILGQLERFDLRALGLGNPVTWHLFLESQRLAYADRELYIADSDFVSVPIAGLLDRAYLAERSALISPDRAMAEALPGVPRGAKSALADGDEPQERGTSHIAAVDATGTMISYTSTIEGAFGSGLTANGFYLNNELTDFSRSPSVDGKAVANRVEPGKRPRSSMAPTVVFDPEGRPVLAIGAAGGSTIPVTTARAIIGAIDFDLSARQALALPFTMAFGDSVLVEQGSWLERRVPALRALGHDDISLREAPIKAGAIKREGAIWEAARDPRLEDVLLVPRATPLP